MQLEGHGEDNKVSKISMSWPYEYANAKNIPCFIVIRQRNRIGKC